MRQRIPNERLEQMETLFSRLKELGCHDPEVKEATRLWRQTWVLPLLDNFLQWAKGEEGLGVEDIGWYSLLSEPED